MSKSSFSATDQFLYFLHLASECVLWISSQNNRDLPLPPKRVIRLLFNSCWITFRAWKRRQLETLTQIALKEQSGHKSLLKLNQAANGGCAEHSRSCQDASGYCTVRMITDFSFKHVWVTYLECTLGLSESVGLLLHIVCNWWMILLRSVRAICPSLFWQTATICLRYLLNYGSSLVKWPGTKHILFLLNMAQSPV